MLKSADHLKKEKALLVQREEREIRRNRQKTEREQTEK
jgi:hypothetical protein